jgi:hypothetical protein
MVLNINNQATVSLKVVSRKRRARDRPLRPESASNSAAFQDGDQQIYQRFNSFRYVDNVSRFDRCLFPYSYFPQVLQVPEICLGRQGIHIRFQDDAFWPIYSPSSIYQNFFSSERKTSPSSIR